MHWWGTSSTGLEPFLHSFPGIAPVHCSGGGTGVTGPEDLLLGHLTSSLSNTPVTALTPLFGTIGSTEAHWLDRCLVTGATGATCFCRTHPIQRFYEFFLHVFLC